MTVLVADIGGTNSRLAVGNKNGLLPETIRTFRNTGYSSFAEVLAAFTSEQRLERIDACCIAIAGPIVGEYGKLTNRDWTVSRENIPPHLGCMQFTLINDLSALGHAIGHLPQNGLANIIPGATESMKNGQSLVMGLGTGFNISPVATDRSGVNIVRMAEAGHMALPSTCASRLEKLLGPQSRSFDTAESLFCGRGLEQLYEAMIDNHLSGSEIINALKQGDPNAKQVVFEYAHLLGQLALELKLAFLPLDGIYFAGSVARAVFEAGVTHAFEAGLNTNRPIDLKLGQNPVYLIKEDTAALHGCLAALTSHA
ncbi:MAG: ROK family protein [Rhizobiaceae bacterium]|nr:ROK family protein [Rhizobiaceae bacterium]